MTTPIDSGANAPSSGGGFCAACGAALSAGARFCHRCGTPFGHGAPLDSAPAIATASGTTLATALPWGVAAVALLAFVAILASREPGATAADGPASPSAAGRRRDERALRRGRTRRHGAARISPA